MNPPPIRALVGTLSLVVCLNLAAQPPDEPWFPEAPPLPVLPQDVAGERQTIRVNDVESLYQAAKDVTPGGTILVADGHYMMPRYFAIKTDNVTLRSESGYRHQVVLDGAQSRHGELVGITGASGVMIADLTIENIKFNGFKINSNLGTEKVTIRNCVIHNIWQRGIKAPAMPKEKGEQGPRDCIVQYCLFYNDRPKRFSDDETDTPDTFDGNYIGGIDVKNTVNWTISDNVFLGIQGRTREGRAGVYISENGRGCTIERNIFIDCDIAIALGNPTLGYSPLQAIDCTAQNNLVSECPETGILACFTRDCRISGNTIYDPNNKRQRLIWVQESDEGLRVKNNLLIGPPIQVTSKSEIEVSDNVIHSELTPWLVQPNMSAGQNFLPGTVIEKAIELAARMDAARKQSTAAQFATGRLSPKVITAMQQVHQGFDGQHGYVAQLGDSITHSMAFWSPMGWSEPQTYLNFDDELPRKPATMRWRDYIKGTRDKGPKHANYSGWRVNQVLAAMDEVMRRDKPEVAIIMVGTNDISGGRLPDDYRKGLEQIVGKCIAAHCVPILNTIPPRRGHDQAVAKANQTIREIADSMRVPLADFHAECLRRRGEGSWDGTLISSDGVHPSGGKSNDYSDQNLANCGYALRNWINFLVYRQLYFKVLDQQERSGS